MAYDSELLQEQRRGLFSWLLRRGGSQAVVTDEGEKAAIRQIGAIDRLLAKLRQ